MQEKREVFVMKKIRLVSLLMAIFLFLALAACGSNSGNSGNDAVVENEGGDAGNDGTSGSKGQAGAEIAFIIPANQEAGINDKGWIQNIWTAMSEWCEENGKTCTYYQTVDDSKQSHVDTYDHAI
jgi:basic membrane lipoprotein Med (substrate-binding protein (PBP1-ABC) superfamily)